MKMYTDPRGKAYEQVIDLAIRNCAWFVLRDKVPGHEGKQNYKAILEILEPYLVKTIVIKGVSSQEISPIIEQYPSRAFYCAGTYYMYACSEASGEILKQVANRLSDWIFPRLPEDLCFLKENGEDYLYSVVHENMYGMEITEEEAIALMEQIPGLFLKLTAHQELDRLLDDAIRHKTDRLYISGHGLTELPERIRELTELRWLEIFERDLYQLPEGLFELTNLEHLSIMTADLAYIPPSIAKLKNLRELSINCGSSDRPSADYQIKPKEEISLNHIPPEIGELEMLEQLTIRYTAIKEVPIELEKLKQLKFLDLGLSMIACKPDFLKRMQLNHCNVSQNFM